MPEDVIAVYVISSSDLLSSAILGILNRDNRYMASAIPAGCISERMPEIHGINELFVCDEDTWGDSVFLELEKLKNRFGGKFVLLTTEVTILKIAMTVEYGLAGILCKKDSLAKELNNLLAQNALILSSTAVDCYKRYIKSAMSAKFTNRQLDIIHFMKLGYSAVQIAKVLHLSPDAIYKHQSRLRERFSVKTNMELIKIFM